MSSALVHLMYFPWDRDQRLKADPEDFDHAPVEALRKYAEGMAVRLWTYPAVRALCEEHYPEVWAALQAAPRPVMMVDVLRWVVVHRFGGIYWQMNSTPLVRMESFLPAAGKSVRLFTEFDLTEVQCRRAMGEPIREGRPEESKRVMIQTFAAVPGAPFVRSVIRFLLDRIGRYRPQNDYDILFITGNAAVSTAYDQFGRNDSAVELTDLADSRRMMKLHYQGAWRTDRSKSLASPVAVEARTPSMFAPPPFWSRKFRDLYFRYAVRHPHEDLFEKLAAAEKEPGDRVLDLLTPFLKENGIRKVVEVPGSVRLEGALPGGVSGVGGHPSRQVVRNQKKADGALGRAWKHLNLLYSRLPKGGLFICPEYLEWVPFGEALRILARIETGGSPYLAFTHCPLLDQNWDASLGDHRPLNMCLEPFGLGEPLMVIPWPDPQGRPDRSLAVWNVPAINGRRAGACQGA